MTYIVQFFDFSSIMQLFIHIVLTIDKFLKKELQERQLKHSLYFGKVKIKNSLLVEHCPTNALSLILHIAHYSCLVLYGKHLVANKQIDNSVDWFLISKGTSSSFSWVFDETFGLVLRPVLWIYEPLVLVIFVKNLESIQFHLHLHTTKHNKFFV